MSTDIQQAPSTVKARLPKFLSFSIFALIALTVLTIAALFIDSIEDKGSRIFLTFIVFGIFVGLTALDTLKSTEREWYPPTALLSNGIFLGASLLTIWLSPANFFGFVVPVLSLVFLFALILRAGIFLGFLAMDAVDKERTGGRSVDSAERGSSLAATWLGNGAAVLFTAYLAATTILAKREMTYDLATFWDIYLKISTAVLILAGLTLSVSLLLRWFFGADEHKAQAELRTASVSAYSPNASQPAPSEPVAPQLQQALQRELLPWPTFANGQPFPADKQGLPDFEAARRMAPPAQAPVAPPAPYPAPQSQPAAPSPSQDNRY